MKTDKIKEFHYKQLKKDPYILATLLYKEQQHKDSIKSLKEENRKYKEENLMLSIEVKVLREMNERINN